MIKYFFTLNLFDEEFEKIQEDKRFKLYGEDESIAFYRLSDEEDLITEYPFLVEEIHDDNDMENFFECGLYSIDEDDLMKYPICISLDAVHEIMGYGFGGINKNDTEDFFNADDVNKIFDKHYKSAKEILLATEIAMTIEQICDDGIEMNLDMIKWALKRVELQRNEKVDIGTIINKGFQTTNSL